MGYVAGIYLFILIPEPSPRRRPGANAAQQVDDCRAFDAFLFTACGAMDPGLRRGDARGKDGAKNIQAGL